MQYQDITNKSAENLKTLLKEKQEQLRALSFDTAGTHARNVKERRSIRKDIARVQTALRQTASTT